MKSTLQLLKEANDILRSVNSIIERRGETTNWEGIDKKVKMALDEQHELLLVKNCSIPAVSVVREPVVLGAVCPHFDTCQNGGKNKFCDLQTFKELDCFVGQTER